ncbi:diguanylate cyclase [Proteocatella sphenisci]|uniref:diguanylate cyclase n=1 Tax=Proteocatella sphenisci TaxID=181070 RepID=UPI00048F937F|nr:diguanylate cyclase [Proteocatella sphenisci]
MVEKTNKLRKISGTLSLIFVIILSLLIAFPPDFVERVETYLLGSSHINLMEISDKKTGRGWRSFDLSDMEKDDWSKNVVYVDFPNDEGIRVYQPIVGENLHKEIRASRNILKTYYMLSDDFDPERSLFIFVDNPGEDIEINFSNYDDFSRIQNLEIIFIAVILGFICAFFIINLILYKSNGETIYVWHAIYVAIIMVTLYYYSGMKFFLTGMRTSYTLLSLMKILTVLFSLNFTYRYLTFGKKSETIEKIYTFASFFFVIISVIMVVSMDRNISMELETLFMAAYILIIVSALVFYYKYDHVSIYYLAGTLLLEFGAILNGASDFNWIKSSVIIRMFFYLSIGLEGLLFTMGIIENAKMQKILHQDLEDKVATDALTGLKNRYYCDTHIKDEFFGKDSEEKIISMLIIDIDYFKNVNDKYGHDVGDSVLSEMSDIFASSVRSSDIVMRWGGEEFVILLPDVRLSDANSIANKINKRVRANVFKTVNKITVSIGVAQKQSKESFESLFKRCDSALYVAKENGRNTVVSSRGVSDKAIPLALEWSESLECGNELIDMQHRKMHSMMNDLLENYFEYGLDDKFEKKFNEAMNFIQEHFNDEENLLREWGYPKLAEHSKMHAELLDHTVILRKKVEKKTMSEGELVSYVVNEVVFGHLVNEDRDFYKYVK